MIFGIPAAPNDDDTTTDIAEEILSVFFQDTQSIIFVKPLKRLNAQWFILNLSKLDFVFIYLNLY